LISAGRSHPVKSISNDEIELVLKKANAWKFVNEFPRKLETYAGERGVKLSGGQKQRLAIARAIIRKPTMVILDEATSALDSKAEVVVQEALDQMIEEKSDGCTLIVAHRLSTLRTCDRIIVMDKGSIKEMGSHAELMEIAVEKDDSGSMKQGWYRDLYETQHGKSGDKGEAERLKVELATLQEELAQLRADNAKLEDKANTFLKLGKSWASNKSRSNLTVQLPHLLPPLPLERHCSEEGTCGRKAPPLLDLIRSSTAPQ